MNIGVVVTVTEMGADIIPIAQRAEALGFESLWVPEHPIIPVYIYTPFPNSPDGRVPESYYSNTGRGCSPMNPFLAVGSG